MRLPAGQELGCQLLLMTSALLSKVGKRAKDFESIELGVPVHRGLGSYDTAGSSYTGIVAASVQAGY